MPHQGPQVCIWHSYKIMADGNLKQVWGQSGYLSSKKAEISHSAVPEDVRLTFHYFALQMPVTVHYNLSYNFGIYLGSNFIAANLSSYKLGVSTGVLGSSAM